ncbi:hypothetical protein C8Q77DRAFT_249300 [Trametes polyzona]|nr:hypothetical protein C8Q77DRAFT_249300 [Trametes polyzona]
MSATTSTIKATITVIGATGQLGESITTVLLTDFRQNFPTVRALTRDPTSAKAQELAKKGAEVVKLDYAHVSDALAGSDVIVNVLPTSVAAEDRRKVDNAAINSGAKVYFLSHFGLDPKLVHFDGYLHQEWASKLQLEAEARKAAQDKLKIISVYNSIFLDIVLSPFIGFDLEKNVYTPYGSASAKFATTSKADIGRAVASLSLLALDPSSAASVPDEVRIAGSIVSFEDVRDIVARVKGVAPGEIKSEDAEKVKNQLREQKGDGSILDYLRVALGEGWLNLSPNENELVNPGQKLWKWKTVEDQIRGL